MVKGPRKHTHGLPETSEVQDGCLSGRGCKILMRLTLVGVGCFALNVENWKDVELVQPVVEGTKNLTRSAVSQWNTTKKRLAMDSKVEEEEEEIGEDPSNHPEGSIAYYIALSRKQHHDKERLLYLLRDHAGLRYLSPDKYQALPTWKEVTNLYGSSPRLIGASPEQCQAFRSQSANRKILAVAGMFNTGTNLLAHTLFQNCIIDPPNAATPTTVLPSNPGPKTTGISWQVAYGKHSPARNESFRRDANNKDTAYEDILPVVMIRDPLQWMISLCTDMYTTHWPKLFRPDHPNYHCPSLWPSDIEQTEFAKRGMGPIVVGVNDQSFGKDLETGNIDQGIYPLVRGQPPQNSTAADIANHHYFPLHVVYGETKRHHYSMLHLWNDWNLGHYQAYDDSRDAPAHRILLRMEDLLFHTQPVMQQVCECAGGHLVQHQDSNSSSVRIPSKSAKGDHPHHWAEHENKTRNGYLESLIRAGNAQQRMEPFTNMDLQYAKYHLDKELMQAFQYQYPPS